MIFLIILLYFILGMLVVKATVWLLTEGNPSSFVNEFDDEIHCITTTFFLMVFFPVVLAGMVFLILGVVGYSFVIGFGGDNPLKEYIEAVKENLEKRKEK
jgi:low temperature requirement protein LtrA